MKKIITILIAIIFAIPTIWGQETDKWELIFEDNFDGTSFNTDNWSYCTRGNPAWKKYLVSNNPQTVRVENGTLIVSAIKNPDTSIDNVPYLTGGIKTKGKVNIKYGKVEVRAKFKNGKGAWPAIWMMPEDGTGGWPACGEIDIMEHINNENIIYQTIHSHYANTLGIKNNPSKGSSVSFSKNDYNIYGIEWYPEKIDFTLNGIITFTYPRINTDKEGQWPFNKSFYLILNQAAGGNWAGKITDSELPFQMKVDWVKMYNLNDSNRPYNIPNWKGHKPQNDTHWKDTFVEKITSTNTSKPFEYIATKRPDSYYVEMKDTLIIYQNSSFSLNLKAFSLGEYNESTILQDLRYTATYFYTDFDGDKQFDFSAPKIGNIPPKNSVGGNFNVLNINKTFTVPSTVNENSVGKIRIVYHNAWKKRSSAYQDVYEGVVYDFNVKIIKKPTDIKYNTKSPININWNNNNIFITNITGNNIIKLYNLTGKLIFSTNTSKSSITINKPSSFSILEIINSNGTHNVKKIY